MTSENLEQFVNGNLKKVQAEVSRIFGHQASAPFVSYDQKRIVEYFRHKSGGLLDDGIGAVVVAYEEQLRQITINIPGLVVVHQTPKIPRFDIYNELVRMLANGIGQHTYSAIHRYGIEPKILEYERENESQELFSLRAIPSAIGSASSLLLASRLKHSDRFLEEHNYQSEFMRSYFRSNNNPSQSKALEEECAANSLSDYLITLNHKQFRDFVKTPIEAAREFAMHNVKF